jgi:hypothetical protein
MYSSGMRIHVPWEGTDFTHINNSNFHVHFFLTNNHVPYFSVPSSYPVRRDHLQSILFWSAVRGFNCQHCTHFLNIKYVKALISLRSADGNVCVGSWNLSVRSRRPTTLCFAKKKNAPKYNHDDYAIDSRNRMHVAHQTARIKSNISSKVD